MRVKLNMVKKNELELERQRRIALEEELATLKGKKPLNYHEPFPGFRVKRWVVIAGVDMVLFGTIVLNVNLTENQFWLLLLACAIGPAVWMAWMSKLTGVEYFDD